MVVIILYLENKQIKKIFMILFVVALLDFILNIPFGYWRSSEKFLSLNWFLSIHIPIPIIVIIRHLSGVGFAFSTYPILIFSFFAGQFFGKILFNFFLKRKFKVSKCICKDILQIINT